MFDLGRSLQLIAEHFSKHLIACETNTTWALLIGAVHVLCIMKRLQCFQSVKWLCGDPSNLGL